MNDLDLLAIQAEGSFDHRGRVVGWDGVKIACSAGGHALWIGADVPEALVAELGAAFNQAPHAMNPAQPPPALELCRRALEGHGRFLPCTAGPSFLIVAVPPPAREIHIERSDAANLPSLRNANPGNWESLEWSELLDGRLGPWTMAIEGKVVVSICHTPVPITARGAECGVWTNPAFRGRGYGAAVVSAWAQLLRTRGRHLFYSTNAENLRSQRLAQRLQLRPLGWTWRLGQAREDVGAEVHPLSSLR